MTEKDYREFARALARRRADPTSGLRELTEAGYTEYCNGFATIFHELNPALNVRTFLEITDQIGHGEHADVRPPQPVKSLREAVALVEQRKRAVVVDLAGVTIKVFPPRLLRQPLPAREIA